LTIKLNNYKKRSKMYIRRKVFSKLQTEDGQERYFSTTEFIRISEAEQREFSRRSNLKDDLKKAIKEGDDKKVEELEKKSTRRKTSAGAIIGAATGGVGMQRLLKKYKEPIKDTDPGLREIDDDTYGKASNIVSGGSAGLGAGIGAGIGYAVGKARFNKALKKAKKELQEEKEEKSNSKKSDKKCC
jgi:hypothetical protein